ncbi:putative disease resistance protein RGA1 [Triticum dicoccoides]|uniref:putative disease resistance protein RGA1 n=1 Tax=Triticum dicoccoides TaxID=85692 RepID=UPI00188EDD0E|nr:putative disease resistance protein RGA1 [Triticum dicoccoides]
MAMPSVAHAVVKMVRKQIDSSTTGPITLQSDLGGIKMKLEEVEAMFRDAKRGAIWTQTEWLEPLKNAAYEISDMIYEYEAKEKPDTRKAYCFRTKIAMADMRKKMKDRLNEITNLYGSMGRVLSIRPEGHYDLRETSGMMEANIIGRDKEKQEIIDCLSGSRTQHITILPIYGIAAIGKTALAQSVFNDYRFRDYTQVWVYVSMTFDLKKIGNSILAQVSEEGGYLVEMDMIVNRLREILAGKEILVVLDDLWENDPSQLQDLKSMLQFGEGVKVIVMVTTRDEAIAREICTIEPYKVAPVTDNMCWSIVKRNSRFESTNGKEQLEQIGIDIAMKCQVVPLAATIVGRGLGWQSGREYDMWNIPNADDTSSQQVLQSLLLSYDHMPPELQLCFAYCAILPRNRSIIKKDLIRQWIALGFIKPSSTSSATQDSEYYVARLLELSFLKHAESTSTTEPEDKDAMLNVDGLLHDLARSVMMGELIVVDANNTGRYDRGRYAVLTHCDARSLKVSSILPGHTRALHCSNTELTDDSFSFAKCMRVLELRESSMQKLPDSICQLRYLGYLNLSGCSRLITLPESFGDLMSLEHINLSGCSGLTKLPQSFGDLISLVHINLSCCSGLENLLESFGGLKELLHINLSGCSRLVKLPQSFGNLINLLHINLSGCSLLAKLPESFGKLKKLLYLDLSFCSCFEGIFGLLAGLTSLQHLNLAHPCCSRAEHRSALQGLAGVLGKFTQLQYLNLSMFLNNMFYYWSEMECVAYIGSCISGLSKLEHLDLSHNIFLTDLPESMSGLNKLHTLDLSGCIRLKRLAKRIGEMSSLKLIALKNCEGLESCQFVVGVNSGPYSSTNNLFQLEVVDCKELEISCLEKVTSLEEARRIKLVEKQKVETLKLYWTSIGDAGGPLLVEENALLGELVPPHSLKCLEIHGYGGETCLPVWQIPSISSHLPNLMEVIMEEFPRCMVLPPLGILPNLKRLVLRKMASITRIDDGDLSGGNHAAFSQLSKVTIDDMENLKLFLFRSVDELLIQKCPELSFGPLPPRAQRLVIADCNKVVSSWGKRQGDGDEGSSSSTPVTELVVENCNLSLGGWSLLRHLPGLRTLCLFQCDSMTSLPEEVGDLRSLQELKIVCCKELNYLPDSMQQLASLQSMYFSECERIEAFPEWFEHLTSLQRLDIHRCPAISSLPRSMNEIASLKDVRVSGCERLKRWYESLEHQSREKSLEDKTKPAQIRLHFEEIGSANRPGHQLPRMH